MEPQCCAGLLRGLGVRVVTQGPLFFPLRDNFSNGNMSLRRVKPQLEDYDDDAMSDLSSGKEARDGGESMDEDEDDGSGAGSSSSEEEEAEDEEVRIHPTPPPHSF